MSKKDFINQCFIKYRGDSKDVFKIHPGIKKDNEIGVEILNTTKNTSFWFKY